MAESCICADACDLEGPSAIWRENRRSRKARRCSECRAAIQPGEQYERIRGIWDGDPDVIVTCAACADVRSQYGCCGLYGEMWSDLYQGIYDSGGRYDDASFRQLSAAGRAKMLALIEKAWARLDAPAPPW